MNKISEDEKKLKEFLDQFPVEQDPVQREKAFEMIRDHFGKKSDRHFLWMCFNALVIGLPLLFGQISGISLVASEEPTGAENAKITRDKAETNSKAALQGSSNKKSTSNDPAANTKQHQIPMPAAYGAGENSKRVLKQADGEIPYRVADGGIGSGNGTAGTKLSGASDDRSSLVVVGSESKSDQQRQHTPAVVGLESGEGKADKSDNGNSTLVDDRNKSDGSDLKSQGNVSATGTANKSTEDAPAKIARDTAENVVSGNTGAKKTKKRGERNWGYGFGILGGATMQQSLNAGGAANYKPSFTGGLFGNLTIGDKLIVQYSASFVSQSATGFSKRYESYVYGFGRETKVKTIEAEKLYYLQNRLSGMVEVREGVSLIGSISANYLLQVTSAYTETSRKPFKSAQTIASSKENGYTQGFHAWHFGYGTGVQFDLRYLDLQIRASRTFGTPVDNSYFQTQRLNGYTNFEISLFYDFRKSKRK